MNDRTWGYLICFFVSPMFQSSSLPGTSPLFSLAHSLGTHSERTRRGPRPSYSPSSCCAEELIRRDATLPLDSPYNRAASRWDRRPKRARRRLVEPAAGLVRSMAAGQRSWSAVVLVSPTLVLHITAISLLSILSRVCFFASSFLHRPTQKRTLKA